MTIVFKNNIALNPLFNFRRLHSFVGIFDRFSTQNGQKLNSVSLSLCFGSDLNEMALQSVNERIYRPIPIAVLTANERLLFFLRPREVHDRLTTEWTPVVALLDPALETSRVEVMPRVAVKLCHYVVLLVVYEADDALLLMLEHVRVVSSARQTGQDHRHLRLTDAARGTSAVLGLVPDHAVEARDSHRNHDPHEADEVPDEKYDEHNTVEERGRVVEVAVVLVGVEHVVAVIHAN